MLIVGAIDESTGQSWCASTANAQPEIDSLVNDVADGRTVLTATVTKEEWKHNEEHPYRKEPFNVQSVPAMLLFEGAEIVYSIYNYTDFKDEAKME